MTTRSVPGTIKHKLERHVAASAKARQLFSPGEHLLVAVSGGPDSVALLTVLASLATPLRLKLTAIHINYGLRGEESEEDARFVVSTCKELGVPLTCKRVDLSGTSPQFRGASLQMRAREARYEMFRRTAAAVGAGKIALGHTADDHAETLMLWVLRGAGSAGLAGIPPVRDGVYVRPLFDIGRVEVLSYLEAKGRAFRTDSSNLKPVYLRNRIRHELMPLLKQFNPSLLAALTQQSIILRDEHQWFEHSVATWAQAHLSQERDGSLTSSCPAMLKLPLAVQRRVIRHVVRQVTGSVQGVAFGVVEEIIRKIVHGRVGASMVLRGVLIVREHERIRFSPDRVMRGCTGDAERTGMGEAVEVPLCIPSVVSWPPTGQIVRLTLAKLWKDGKPVGRHVARFDADQFAHRLVLRSWKPGDWFCPRGMGGRRKKLSDYFSDIKLPREQRSRVPVLVAPDGILWVVGHRADHRFGVTAATRRMLTVEVGPVETGREDRN